MQGILLSSPSLNSLLSSMLPNMKSALRFWETVGIADIDRYSH